MTTTEANPNTARLAAMRTLLSGAEWARVAAMVGVIVALHLIGWVTLAAFVARTTSAWAAKPSVWALG